MKYNVGDMILVIGEKERIIYTGIILKLSKLKTEIKWTHTERISSYFTSDVDLNISEGYPSIHYGKNRRLFWKHLPCD